MVEPLRDTEYAGPPDSSVPDVDNVLYPGSPDSRRWGARLWLSISSKAPLNVEWIRADNRYRGQHWQRTHKQSWRPDPVSNMVYTIVDEHASQLAASDYDAVFMPRKPSDLDAADLFSDLWQWWYKNHDIRYWMDDVAVCAVLKGTCLLKCIWDQNV
ncbi:MAG: hypothetical protein KGL39_46815, partial [Patescibacteria group bacterium]|nr:hypothetical protein [Patescibacteria group bacterium]